MVTYEVILDSLFVQQYPTFGLDNNVRIQMITTWYVQSNHALHKKVGVDGYLKHILATYSFIIEFHEGNKQGLLIEFLRCEFPAVFTVHSEFLSVYVLKIFEIVGDVWSAALLQHYDP